MSFPVTSTQHAAPDFTPHFTRPRANFRPSIWGDIFLQYDSESFSEVNNSMKQQIQGYKEEVKKMFLSSSNNMSQKLKFIDSIQRLGISYHFEGEINKELEQIHNAYTNSILITEEGGLQYLALLFRLLRQKGYHISSDIFNKFKNKKGKFNETIAQDVLGMWSLYEAAQLRVHGEDILEEALDFTYTNLKSVANQLTPSLAAQINQSLRQPLHKKVPRIEARHFISFYEEDPSHNKILLAFAKLDFNMLQKLHQKEVGSITKWWRKSDFRTKVPYTRDRAVESYFFILSLSHVPKYSTSRRIVGKMFLCVLLLDDTYDAYGTVEELDLFTEAINRWDISLIEPLPECMKVVFNTIAKLCDEIELVILEGGKPNMVLQHIKQDFCNLANAYMVEAKWCHEGCIPTYEEYKANGLESTSVQMLITTFICLGEFTAKEVLDWIITDPTILDFVSLHGRLKDDMGSHKFEQQRVHVASAVECCMKQHGISQEEAYKLIHKETEHIWKDINEACLKLADVVPKPELDCIVNFARTLELTYENFEDGYTDGDLLKDHVAQLLLDPISI